MNERDLTEYKVDRLAEFLVDRDNVEGTTSYGLMLFDEFAHGNVRFAHRMFARDIVEFLESCHPPS